MNDSFDISNDSDIDKKVVEMKIEYKNTQIQNMNKKPLYGINEKVMDLIIIQMVCMELIMIEKN